MTRAGSAAIVVVAVGMWVTGVMPVIHISTVFFVFCISHSDSGKPLLQRRLKAMGTKRKQRKKMSVRDIPYERCFEEAGMIETERGRYTHTYEIIPPSRTKEMTYSPKRVRKAMKKIFRTFGEMPFQFVIRNYLIDEGEYLKKIQIPPGRHEKINACIDSYNSILADNVGIGHNNYESRVYLTVTAECEDVCDAEEIFQRLDEDVKTVFKEMYGYTAKPMMLDERLMVLSNIYNPAEAEQKILESDNSESEKKRPFRNRRNATTKERIAPSFISYERTLLKMDQKYVRLFFMNALPGDMPDSLFCDITAVSGNSILSVSYLPVDSKRGYMAAERLVEANTREEAVAVRDTIADRRERRTEVIKTKLKEDEDAYFNDAAEEVLGDLEEPGEPMLLTTIVIALISDTQDELERDSTLLKLAAYKYGCQIRCCDLLQKEAFQSVLPLNCDRVNYKRAFTLGKIAGVLPVNVHGLFETRPMFQGLNMINDNFIFADRRSCPVGLITGVGHSGKTFSIKRDAMNALMTTDDAVFILTKKPEEYKGVMEAVGGNASYFIPDPFEKDENYALSGDTVALQNLFLMACMTVQNGYYRQKYLSTEKEKIRSRITQEAQMLSYQRFGTMDDANEYARSHGEAFAYYLDAFGMMKAERDNCFSRLNILPCENDLTMLMNLDWLWNYAVAEKKNNRTVWIYLDGADEFLYTTECSDYLLSIMDMAAKIQVPLTMVLDDAVHIVTDQDAAIEADYFIKKDFFLQISFNGPDRAEMVCGSAEYQSDTCALYDGQGAGGGRSDHAYAECGFYGSL